MNTVYSYIIDENDRIVSVDEAWKQFARENGSSQLIDAVIGKSLWDFIGNSMLIGLYQRAAEAVRKKMTDFRMDFRCDSRDQLRFMSMHIIALPDGKIKFESTLLHSQNRGDTRPVELLKRSLEPLSMCGRCNRIKLDNSWQELDSLLEDSTDDPNHAAYFQFGLCDDCSNELSNKIAELNSVLGYCGRSCG